MKTSDFDYSLPSELIAQNPIEPRDHSRLMVLNRSNGSIEHRRFFDIVSYLRDGDVLVFNDSRVIPARLIGRKVDTGGRVEILLLRRLDANVWEALAKPAVSDALLLSKHADAVVFVAKSDATSIRQINQGLDLLARINARVIGVVVNQLDTRKAAKYSDYGYGGYYESYESKSAAS